MAGLTPEAVKQRARGLGFDLCGIAPAETPPQAASTLQAWLARGYHGEMQYMARTAEKRADVRAVLPSAQSVIVLGTIYKTPAPASVERTGRLAALISRYAWGDDYHDVLAARLETLVGWMREEAGEGFEAKPYVDTGPVLERAFAQRAGLGWIGKNTCLISPERGSWLFLCEVICNVPLAPDAAGLDRCGTCTLCLEACPTQAFVDAYALDATRCLSYLTIELKGSVPLGLRSSLGHHVYGCDICQEVCPWNAEAIAPVTEDPAWRARPTFDNADLLTLWRLSDAELRRAIKGTPMTRARLRRLRRNVAIAIGNSGEPSAAAVFDEPIDAPSVADALVREHIEWAIRELSGGGVQAAQPAGPPASAHGEAKT
jgi:epoxyqueuosine reductase